MEPETSTALEQLFKSIQTFSTIQMAADSRDKIWRYNDALNQSLYSILEDQEADAETKMQVLDATLTQYAAAMKNLFPQIISNPVQKADAADQFDMIVEVGKFNPYPDELGRFSSADHYDQFTINTRDPNKQHWADAAIAREKEREARGLVFGPKIKPPKPAESKEQPKDKPKEQPKDKPETYIPVNAPTNTTTNIPTKVLDVCQNVEKKSVQLQNEKMTLVNENGDIVHEKRGGRSRIHFDVYDEAMMGDNITLTHNHPGEYGGTFSGADVSTLAHFNLRAIRAVGVEGTYSLERQSNTTAKQTATFSMDYKALAKDVDNSLTAQRNMMQAKVNNGAISVEDANRHLANHRNKECDRMHNWLIQNAAKYNYNYVFTPSNGGVEKMYDEIEKEDVEETAGEIMLDGELISGDNWMIKPEDLDD